MMLSIFKCKNTHTHVKSKGITNDKSGAYNKLYVSTRRTDVTDVNYVC